MTTRRLSVVLLAALVLAPGIARSQPRAAGSIAPPARFEDPHRLTKLATAFPAIDSLMRDFAERSHVPGVAWGVVVDGALLHAGTAGQRDLSSHAAVDTSTVFRIASMT